jgi:hypothetical protein
MDARLSQRELIRIGPVNAGYATVMASQVRYAANLKR